MEVNPFETKKQRQNAEVANLLSKVGMDTITLDPTRLGEVDILSLEEKMAEKSKKLHLKPPKIDFEPRSKTKGKSGTAKQFHIKRTVIQEKKRVRL